MFKSFVNDRSGVNRSLYLYVKKYMPRLDGWYEVTIIDSMLTGY